MCAGSPVRGGDGAVPRSAATPRAAVVEPGRRMRDRRRGRGEFAEVKGRRGRFGIILRGGVHFPCFQGGVW